MSLFTEFTSVRLPDKDSTLFTLTEPLYYERGFKGSWKWIVVPKWFQTDFASIPWIMQVAWKPYDPRWVKSAIIHDYLWSIAYTLEDYQEANDIFFEAMWVEWTPYALRLSAYLSVSLSKYAYHSYRTLTWEYRLTTGARIRKSTSDNHETQGKCQEARMGMAPDNGLWVSGGSDVSRDKPKGRRTYR